MRDLQNSSIKTHPSEEKMKYDNIIKSSPLKDKLFINSFNNLEDYLISTDIACGL